MSDYKEFYFDPNIISKIATSMKRQEEIFEQRVSKLHTIFSKDINDFNVFVKKVRLKYESDKYQNRWYNRGIEPPETLYDVLFSYAEKYGRKPSKKECKVYSNPFTSGIFIYGNYIFNRMDGQGTVIKINEL